MFKKIKNFLGYLWEFLVTSIYRNRLPYDVEYIVEKAIQGKNSLYPYKIVATYEGAADFQAFKRHLMFPTLTDKWDVVREVNAYSNSPAQKWVNNHQRVVFRKGDELLFLTIMPITAPVWDTYYPTFEDIHAEQLLNWERLLDLMTNKNGCYTERSADAGWSIITSAILLSKRELPGSDIYWSMVESGVTSTLEASEIGQVSKEYHNSQLNKVLETIKTFKQHEAVPTRDDSPPAN